MGPTPAPAPKNRTFSSHMPTMKNVPATKAGNPTRGAHVGPYWFVRDDSGRVLLMAHRCALAAAEEYGDFITCPHGHLEVWEGWRARCAADRVAAVVRDAEYEEWPRGRVVFNSIKTQFIVYADKQIPQGRAEARSGVFRHPCGQGGVHDGRPLPKHAVAVLRPREAVGGMCPSGQPKGLCQRPGTSADSIMGADEL